tara:strand:+ start:549 stop:839 length:291 start_codon:yes stop_codon:yes gene_type:complete
MSWRDIVRKSNCMAKMGKPCDCSECMKKAAKPDFLDLDGDGNKTEPMREAAKNKKHDDSEKKAKMKCPKCKGKGCDHCKGSGYHEVKSKNPFTRKD